MQNKNYYKEERFDSFLNKTIILSSKRYYKYEKAKDFNELKIIDDEYFSEFINEYLKYEETAYTHENIDDFIEQLDNMVLVHALKSLSKIELMVIFLLFEKQLSSTEASKNLKICSDSVTRIKKRALKKLEKYLKGGK